MLYFNLIIRVGVSSIFALVLISCSPDKQGAKHIASASEREQRARAFLNPLLNVGDTELKITDQFGSPGYSYEAKNLEQRMYFYFSNTNIDALKSGVGGFTGFFNSNRLTSWEPIYVN